MPPGPVTASTPMAASAAVGALLSGPPRAVEVAVVTPQAVYLATGDPRCPALCLVGPRAVRVPCALVVGRMPAGSVVGDTGPAGAGTLSLPSFGGRVARWWRPPRPDGLDTSQLRSAAVELSRRVPEVSTPRALDGLVGAIVTGGPLTGPVARLVGWGPGLTPMGDDLLAGMLVTLGALGAPSFEPLGTAVGALAPTRTTFVSAALLHHAARGECVPELAAVLTAQRDGIAVAAAVDALLGIGHTSGAGLARGVLAALDLVSR